MDKIKKSWDIRLQLVAGTTILTIGAIALIGFLSMKMLEYNALFRKAKEAEIIMSFIRRSLAEADGEQNMGRIKEFMNDLAKSGAIRGLSLIDSRGAKLVSVGQGLSGAGEAGKSLFLIKGLNITMIGGGWLEGIGTEMVASMQTRAPGIAGSAGSEGAVILSLPLSDIKDERANFRRFILFYALFDSVIIIVFGIYIFSKGIIRPMRLLKDTAESIAGGSLDHRVDIKAADEIESFASSFNIMADRLEEKIKTLERVNKELVTAQEGLVRSEKLATVGRLAAGVAHEIGNPLGAILGYVDILKKGADAGESDEILDRVEKELLRINSIIRGLLDFSRPSKGAPSDVDVNAAIKDCAAIILPQFSKSNITFDMKLDTDAPHVIMDKGMLQQILLNLFLNAKDAMNNGGKILVETGVSLHGASIPVRKRKGDHVEADFAVSREEAGGQGYIVIAVTDTGKGIAEEDIGRIFDPFFTTKEQGKGTGLGLTVSLGIVQAYGGDIRVKSAIGKGTRFEVLFPFSGDEK